MATNDFLVFGGGAGANVMTQADWAALSARVAGFSAGVAQSAQLNKAWRQSSIMAAVLAQFISDRAGVDVLDDGTIATILANLKASAAAVNGDATKTFSVAAATAAAHALNQATGDARYAALAGLATQVFSVAAPTAAGHATPLSEFAASLTANGYMKIPVSAGGVKRTLIFQWGTVAGVGAASSANITFPITFPNAVLNVMATIKNSGGSSAALAAGVGLESASGMTVFNNGNGLASAINWNAIGY